MAPIGPKRMSTLMLTPQGQLRQINPDHVSRAEQDGYRRYSGGFASAAEVWMTAPAKVINRKSKGRAQ